MSGRGKGVRSRRTRFSPYDNVSVSDRQWDLENPSNWTIHKLREELNKKGIKTPSSLSKSVLKQLYVENSTTSEIPAPQIPLNRINTNIATSSALSAEPEVTTENTINGPCLGSSDLNNTAVPNTSPTEQNSINVDQLPRNSNSDGIHGDHGDTSIQRANFNSMATMSTMMAQFFSGFQQSLSQFNQTWKKGNDTDTCNGGFNLHQWYREHNSTASLQNPMFQTGLQQDLLYSSSTAQQPDLRVSTIQQGPQGVRSDSFTNVDIISPTIQKQIIEAATLLREQCVKVDWSKRDRDILNLVTAGASINICKICNMVDHTTAFCSMQSSGKYQSYNKTSRQFEASIDQGPKSDIKTDKLGRNRVYLNGEEICNNFNGDRGCQRLSCPFKHVCSRCNLSNHSLSNCRVTSLPHFNKSGEQNTTSTSRIPSSSQNNGKPVKK
ncbi:unnamed protein product [Mytilus coruscus]|uniref:C3H1-type domain-containing protein n=1 Tax=Mytilus coruscus TaxID=42192 RepID=A0A6J8B184_MYTCO|nr:unnamed protein product [Mytilus coruscus]